VTPSDYCADKAAPAGSGLYYALLYHDSRERRALHACFALLEELRPDSGRVADPIPVVRRLLWWLEELEPERLRNSRHPVAIELRSMPGEAGAIRAAFRPVIGARLRELDGWQPDTDADWQSHCEVLNSGAWQLAARHCTNLPEPEWMRRIGSLAGLHGRLAQILEMTQWTAAGHCPLSRETLTRHGAISASRRPAAGVLWGAAAALADEVRRELVQSDPPGTTRHPPLPLFCRVLRRIDLGLCDRILHRPQRLLQEHVTLTPLRKLGIAWWESRRGTTSHGVD
jgi:phytoene synthase